MIKKIIPCVLSFLFLPIYTFSQNVDSLERLLPRKTGVEKVDILYKLSSHYSKMDSEKSLLYGLEGYRLSQALNDEPRIVQTGLFAAKAYRAIGKIDSAVRIYDVILPVSKRNNCEFEYLVILNGYALTLTFKAQYDKALAFHFESLNNKSVYNDSLSIITSLHNIGLVYYKLKDYNKALYYFLRCDDAKRRINDSYDWDLLMFNIGLSYGYLRMFDEALEYIDKGMEICGIDCPPKNELQALFAYGLVFFEQNDFSRAEYYFLQSYAMARAVHDSRYQFDNIYYLSQICTSQNKMRLAASYLRNAELLIDEDGSFNLERIKIYAQFSQLYIKVKDYEKASHYLMKYVQMKDSVYNEDLTMNLMRAEALFLERENSIKISSQGELLVLKEEVIRWQQTLNVISLLLSVLFLVLVILLLHYYRRKRILSFLLERKVYERTRDLQSSRDESIKAMKENELLLSRHSQSICDAINTISGLCLNGMKEVNDPTALEYLKRIQKTSLSLFSSFGVFTESRTFRGDLG